MKQKYDQEEVLAPGTVIVSAAAHCNDITKAVEPVLQKEGGPIYYLNLSGSAYHLGGSSFAQTQNKIGLEAPNVKSAKDFAQAFDLIQTLIQEEKILPVMIFLLVECSLLYWKCALVIMIWALKLI